MPTVYGAIDLLKNELRNAVIQNLGTAPSTPSKGQLYMNSSDNTLYWWDGAQWIAAKAAAGATPAATVTTQAVGDAPVVGVSTNFAREDHKHGREAFAAVVAQTAFGAASNNGVAVTLPRSDHVHGTPTHDAAAHSAISRSAFAVPTADISWGGFKITSLADPGAPTDAANKQYVDNLSAGLSWKEAVRAATTANITLSGLQTIDGISVIATERVLVKNQTTASANGIYVVASGAWTRATDADAAGELEGMAVFVMEGTTLADTAWVCTTNAPITVGSTNLAFAQFAGGGAITAGAGQIQNGNAFDVVAADTSLTVNADNMLVNTAVIASRSYVDSSIAAIGAPKKATGGLTGTAPYATGELILHNLNTRDIVLMVVNGSSPYQAVEVDWEVTSTTTATIRFNPALGAGYRWIAMG